MVSLLGGEDTVASFIDFRINTCIFKLFVVDPFPFVVKYSLLYFYYIFLFFPWTFCSMMNLVMYAFFLVVVVVVVVLELRFRFERSQGSPHALLVTAVLLP